MGTRKRRAEITSSPDHDPSDLAFAKDAVPPSADEHLLLIPDSQRALISLTGKGFERALLWKLDWVNYMYVPPPPASVTYLRPESVAHADRRKVIALATTGYRPDAVRLVGERVMQPRGLTGLALDTLDASTAEIRAVFERLARDESYPVLVHCTQGKDRTGLVVLLTLLLVGGVPEPAIVDDYVRSELELVPEFEERMREIRALGLGEDYTRCPPGFVDATTRYLRDRYGGVRGYLGGIGIDATMQERIRRKMLP